MRREKEECKRLDLSERVDEIVWECEAKRMTVRENLCVRQSVCESESEGETVHLRK